jgi:hypothetical protein
MRAAILLLLSASLAMSQAFTPAQSSKITFSPSRFVPAGVSKASTTTAAIAVGSSFPLDHKEDAEFANSVASKPTVNDSSLVRTLTFNAITLSALVAATSPVLAAVDAAAGDYEYGAVNAPIGLAVGGGILAILTALLPVALRGGEDAFNEIRDRDASTFGDNKKNKNVLNKRR